MRRKSAREAEAAKPYLYAEGIAGMWLKRTDEAEPAILERWAKDHRRMFGYLSPWFAEEMREPLQRLVFRA